ncbi:hypothetical protein [Algoriphagus sp. A40]|uniref:hypothetical protein n=1 Tax=Algoriphagus sp. A40 TaxID=1945863 RepID=UPI0009875592|nr:hypothetical protein [Algoriphagus sp. A40]OOG72190.1 hypothetical protein B0E43_16310 [Algoriphagus sp. A40]
MKKAIFSLLFTVLFAFVFSCNEDEEPNTPDPDPDPSSFTTTDVAVIVPPGSTLDLSKTRLFSGFAEYPVDNTGKTKARFATGSTRLAFLIDENDKAVMAGFLTDNQKEISTKTTASVILYFSLGVSLQPLEVKKKFWEGYSTIPGMDDFIAQVSAEMVKNPKVLQTATLEAPLSAYLKTFNSTDSIDIQAKQIDVDPGGFKSGIQVYELDHQNIQIRNQFRRRAHAFVYKTAFKDKDGVETVLKKRIGGNDTAEKDLEVKATSAITSFIGSVKEEVSGKGADFAMTETSPIPLPLKTNESEATYKVRVVGPGLTNLNGLSLTSAERDKLNRLMLETFAMDFFLPFIFDVMGLADVLSIPGSNFKTLITIIDNFVKTTPTIEKLILDGNFDQALKDIIYLASYEVPNAQFDAMVTAVATGSVEMIRGVKPELVTASAEEIGNKAKKALKLLKYADLLIKFVDYNRLMNHIAFSDYNEEFTAIAKMDDLEMTPKESTVVTQTNTTLKVETKTVLGEGESFVYKWSTTAKYGLLSYQGKKQSNFEASVASMVYRAEAKSDDLSDGPNVDTVKVEVFTKKGTSLTRIGDANAVVNVQKIKLIMKPNNITLSGGQNVSLYLVRTDGVNDIVSNAALDYKVEWETAGTYGKFDGTLKNANTMGNRINYEVLDKDVKEGKETITARVYFKAKTDSEWVLRETVKGELKIVNDPKKIIMNIPMSALGWDNSKANSCNVGGNLAVQVPIHPKAVSYSVTFYGFKKNYSWEGKGGSWQAGKTPPSVYGYPPAGDNEILGGNYIYTISRSWTSGPASSTCSEKLQNYISAYQALGGMANVIITITD